MIPASLPAKQEWMRRAQVRASLPRNERRPAQLTRLVLRMLRSGYWTRKEIAEALGEEPDVISGTLHHLEQIGRIHRTGRVVLTNGRPCSVYALPGR